MHSPRSSFGMKTVSATDTTRPVTAPQVDKRPSMIANLDNLIRRAPLTTADIRVIHGIVRALAVKVPGRK